jgi:ferritin-like metal-binding protein YciE
MDDLSKLEHLLAHWIEHNASHEATYGVWIERAETAGRRDVAQMVRESMEHSEQMSRCFEEALQLLKGNDNV